MKILVTGASGFIGRTLIPVLAKKHEVCAFGRSAPQSENKETKFITGDLREPSSIKRALSGIDVVIHLGAVTAGKDPTLTFDTNVKGMYDLAEVAISAKAQKIIFASSIAAYGCLSPDFVPDYLPVDEDHPCKPEDIYGLTKFIGEEILKYYSRKDGIATVSLRITAVRDIAAGPGVATAGKCTLWSAVDVHDVIKAIVLCLEKDIKGSEVFNISTENIVAQEQSDCLIKKHYPEVKADQSYFAKNHWAAFYDISKAKRILGFDPQIIKVM